MLGMAKPEGVGRHQSQHQRLGVFGQGVVEHEQIDVRFRDTGREGHRRWRVGVVGQGGRAPAVQKAKGRVFRQECRERHSDDQRPGILADRLRRIRETDDRQHVALPLERADVGKYTGHARAAVQVESRRGGIPVGAAVDAKRVDRQTQVAPVVGGGKQRLGRQHVLARVRYRKGAGTFEAVTPVVVGVLPRSVVIHNRVVERSPGSPAATPVGGVAHHGAVNQRGIRRAAAETAGMVAGEQAVLELAVFGAAAPFISRIADKPAGKRLPVENPATITRRVADEQAIGDNHVVALAQQGAATHAVVAPAVGGRVPVGDRESFDHGSRGGGQYAANRIPTQPACARAGLARDEGLPRPRAGPERQRMGNMDAVHQRVVSPGIVIRLRAPPRVVDARRGDDLVAVEQRGIHGRLQRLEGVVGRPAGVRVRAVDGVDIDRVGAKRSGAGDPEEPGQHHTQGMVHNRPPRIIHMKLTQNPGCCAYGSVFLYEHTDQLATGTVCSLNCPTAPPWSRLTPQPTPPSRLRGNTPRSRNGLILTKLMNACLPPPLK